MLLLQYSIEKMGLILFKVIIYAEFILFHKIFNEDLEYIFFLTKVKRVI